MTAEQIGENLPENIEGLHVHALCESSAEATIDLLDAVEMKFGHLFSADTVAQPRRRTSDDPKGLQHAMSDRCAKTFPHKISAQP